MLKAVCDAVTIPVIASGGAGRVDHFVDAVSVGNASAVLAASVFHFGEISIKEVKEAMSNAGITIRNEFL
jgi:cyclase